MIDTPAIDINNALQAADMNKAKNAAAAAHGVRNMKQIEEAAREFEAMFVTEMLKPMFESVGVDDTFGGGKGEEVFRSFMVDEYGKKIAQTGGIGLAEHVKAEMIRLQEASSQK